MATTADLTATAHYSDDSTTDVTTDADWSSSDEGVATVSAAGVVTAVGAGTTTVTASYQGQSGTSAITVTEPEPELDSLSVAPSTADLETEA